MGPLNFRGREVATHRSWSSCKPPTLPRHDSITGVFLFSYGKKICQNLFLQFILLLFQDFEYVIYVMVPEACELIYLDIFGIDREEVILVSSHYSIFPPEVRIFILQSFCFYLCYNFFGTREKLFVILYVSVYV